jgi:hypothetical protein
MGAAAGSVRSACIKHHRLSEPIAQHNLTLDVIAKFVLVLLIVSIMALKYLIRALLDYTGHQGLALYTNSLTSY